MSNKKNLMPLLQHLDQRADNYFAYDKTEQCYVLAQTWHVRVHKLRTPKDKFELIYVRTGRRFDTEPTDDDIKQYAAEATKMLTDYMNEGQWHGGTVSDDPDTPGFTEPFKFNKWFIKDHREV